MRQRAVGLGILVFTWALLSLGCGSSGTAQFRVVQASPSTSTVNVIIDGTTQANTVAYGGASDYMQVGSGSRHIQIEPINTTTPIVDTTVSLASQTNSTLVVAGVAPNASSFLLSDSQTIPTAGDFSIRVMNAAPSLGPADVYIVPSGTNIATVTPFISALAFEATSPYSSFTPGTFQIFFTIPNSKVSLTNPQNVSFTAGQNRTIIIVDGSSGGFSTLTLADFD
jgi:uncharacterized protein DUF4397